MVPNLNFGDLDKYIRIIELEKQIEKLDARAFWHWRRLVSRSISARKRWKRDREMMLKNLEKARSVLVHKRRAGGHG